jgi:hypothetical protein
MARQSGVLVRAMLRRSGVQDYGRIWRFLKAKADMVFGPGWEADRNGIVLDKQVVVPNALMRAFLMDDDASPAPIFPVSSSAVVVSTPRAAVEAQPDPADPSPANEYASEPTFECGHKGCSYAGYTKKALEAHKKRMGH